MKTRPQQSASSLTAVILTCILLLLTSPIQAATVDVMIVYDTTATSWVASNGGMSSFSQDAVNKMNQALQNSGLSDRFRLVHSMSVNYTTQAGSDPDLSTDLHALQGGEAPFNTVVAARNTYGADLVAMLIDTGSAYGIVGRGYTLSSWSGQPLHAHTVSSIRSVEISHTLTHEIGHNLGAHHSKSQASSPGPNTYLDNQYSAGWYITDANDGNDYHTIMAYQSDGSKTYDPVPLFSTPDITHQGKAAGHANDGDNVRLLKQTFPTIANYRDPMADLTSITLSGPDSVNESSTATYSATAHYSDGSSQGVTPSWSENSSRATINTSGLLTTTHVNSNTQVTISASYTSGSITKAATKNVTITDSIPNLTSITITGPTSIDEGSVTDYNATAHFSDGSSSSVNPSWSENSGHATINSSGQLSASSVTGDVSVTISASYTTGLNTRTDSHLVTIRDVPPHLTGLSITGPSSVNETGSASYGATAHYSDGSSQGVTPSWSENSNRSTINGSGTLSTTHVNSDTAVTISASYTNGSTTKSATKNVTITDSIPNLTSITITGPTSVAEESVTDYNATAHFSDGSSSSVNPSWSENSTYSTIDSSGRLTASMVTTDVSVTISASYTTGLNTRTDSHLVTIENGPVKLSGLTINGPASVDEHGSGSYSATAHFDDGSTRSVSPQWSENSGSATINSSGKLTTSYVNSDQQLTLSASYTSGQITRNASKNVTIKDTIANLTGLVIHGPTLVEEQSTATYSARASFSDGSSRTVTPVWSVQDNHATISASGILTALTVKSDTRITVSARYSHGLNSRTDSHEVQIRNRLTLGEALDNETLVFSTGGDSPWFIKNTSPDKAKPLSLESGAIDNDQQSWLQTTIKGPGILQFYWMVSSEPNRDFLDLYLGDSQLLAEISGESDWVKVSVEIPKGEHTLRWVYSKDHAASAGIDCGRLDQVTWSPQPAATFPWNLFIRTISKKK